ncbi:MAG TPA: hypothetical protein VHT27_04460 [Solirubrobacteraceae bacterium]|jgi:hypothetical protein|nr:hypothetical protein [Solirubrobacteraceae bacterium]
MRLRLLGLCACLLGLLVMGAGGARALAAEAVWRSEEPTPAGSSWPIGLGKVGDIEFWAPNRGLLITSGSPPTVPAGVWAYNGVQWHSLATVCGATDGRIAWAGPDEFWTVSDGRAGQTSQSSGGLEEAPPLEDNTLCRFANGAVIASYAHPAFEAGSYRAMHAAACIAPSDCWFAGDALPEPQVGAFHLHWNGTTLEPEPYPGEGHPVEAMAALEGDLFESVRIAAGDRVSVANAAAPALHKINPIGIEPVFEPEDEGGLGLPLYSASELPRALEALHLSVADGNLWAAASRKYGESSEEPVHANGQVTVAIREGGSWRQLIGPAHPLGPIFPPSLAAEEGQFHVGAEPGEARKAEVSAIAAEPGGGGAWLGLVGHEPSRITPRAVVTRISAEGQVLETQELPSDQEEEEGIGPKGSAAKLSCPQANDCWLVTTQGWLFHLAPETERTLPLDADPNFSGPITFRPVDQGLPQVTADAPPADTSGLQEEQPVLGAVPEAKKPEEAKVTLPLLSNVHSRLIHGTTLELKFHLAVIARVKLVAKHKRRVVAATARRTLKAGSHSLRLRLDTARWPTSLALQTHPLVPLPVVSSVTGAGATIGTETTALRSFPADPALTFAQPGRVP